MSGAICKHFTRMPLWSQESFDEELLPHKIVQNANDMETEYTDSVPFAQSVMALPPARDIEQEGYGMDWNLGSDENQDPEPDKNPTSAKGLTGAVQH